MSEPRVLERAAPASVAGGAGAAQAPPERQGVSIVVPAYDEQAGMRAFLESLAPVVRELEKTLTVEVWIVDDGSQDRTAAEVQPFLSERVHLLRHERNLGYGAAIKTGVARATQPWVLITDADCTYPSQAIPALLAARDGCEMVVGARTGRENHAPWLRRPAKWVLRRLASYLSRRSIPDLNSGLRVMRRELLERFARVLPDGFSYTTTITLCLLSSGAPVRYLPIDYHPRAGRSKIRPVQETLNFLTVIVRTVLLFDPLRVFLPAALAFVLLAIGVGFGGYLVSGRVMDVTTVLLFVTGVHLLAIGMLADMLNRRLG